MECPTLIHPTTLTHEGSSNFTPWVVRVSSVTGLKCFRSQSRSVMCAGPRQDPLDLPVLGHLGPPTRNFSLCTPSLGPRPGKVDTRDPSYLHSLLRRVGKRLKTAKESGDKTFVETRVGVGRSGAQRVLLPLRRPEFESRGTRVTLS